MSKIIVEAFIATTNPIPAYDGFALPSHAMYDIANAIRAGRIPMQVEHDYLRQLTPRILAVDVRKTEEGYDGVWVKFEADEQAWNDARSQFKGAGGFSISVMVDPVEPDLTSGKPPLRLSADIAHFDEQTYFGAVKQLQKDFAVGGGRLYQFSELPPPNVIIELTLLTIQTISQNLVSSALYDVIKVWFSRPKKAQASKVTLVVTKEPNGKVHGRYQVETADSGFLKDAHKEALATLQDFVLQHPKGGNFAFHRKSRRWKKAKKHH